MEGSSRGWRLSFVRARAVLRQWRRARVGETGSAVTPSSSPVPLHRPSIHLHVKMPARGEAPIQVTGFYRRPGFSTAGAAAQVKLNHYKVTKLPTGTIYQYDVTIGSDDASPAVRRKVWSAPSVQEEFGEKKVIFDGRKIAYSLGPLPFGNDFTKDVDLSAGAEKAGGDAKGKDRKNVFKVRVKYTNQINLEVLQRFVENKWGKDESVLQAINLLDNLLRQTPARLFKSVGRNFFQGGRARPLAGGVEAWKGIFQSVRPTLGCLTVNVDTATTVFWSGGITLVDLSVLILGRRGPQDLQRMSDRDMKLLNRELKGVGFFVKHRGEKAEGISQKIKRVLPTNSQTTKFQLGADRDTGAGGTESTLSAYFLQKYNKRLAHPTLPILETMRKEKIPMELCFTTPSQKYLRKLNERQTSDMIKITCTRPNERGSEIRQNVQDLGWERDGYLKEYGMGIAGEMMVSEARVLPAPKIVYGKASREAVVQPRDGKWNLQGKKMFEAKLTKGWGVLVFDSPNRLPQQAVQNFCRQFVTVAVDMGLTFGNKTPPIAYANPQGSIQQEITNIWRAAGNAVNARPDMLVFVVPSAGAELYGEIKRVCDIELGVASQVLQGKHVMQAKPQYCANVVMKWNCKLGGVNVVLGPGGLPLDAKEPTILLGADVSHPSPGSSKPSFATVTGSTDLQATKYAAVSRTQARRQELVGEMKAMVTSLLRSFYKNTKQKPKRVLYFRDGVSEGQFKQVMDTEIQDIIEACNGLEAGYRPKITVCIVQKRHHTRFFPSSQNATDRNGNAVPGTLVDRTVTHPSEFDFFLVAHTALQGTARPTHYHVIHDENKFSVNHFQTLVYNMSYVYARSTTSVSLVPVVYYAHLASARVRYHDTSSDYSETETTVSSGHGSGEKEDAEVTALPPIKGDLAQVMYFM
ncbi:hypothetical protein G7K_2074-t1 [Saitoella complicata NRRL Y-17804]|uniref:Piwi domain-containing protein n=1 Tax=Saitoella complicata (strain BCRC 22490 / CBS 7301 / JCM 7358 / NBRC 10748 / NRRL Y-17804) TaxID=698492 RepID=A0A0E9NDK5_SAICN|nr:hypothetical protein G7K_2074-t1 [Saitoella complicata NRRL Y-17804]